MKRILATTKPLRVVTEAATSAYTEMIGTVNKVLGDLKRLFPDDAGQGHEIVGFVWWHGWNDFLKPKKARCRNTRRISPT